ncbi:hypothetical protein [uncultured Erythrobacter sp.]|uniref:hypothetical protein n=1 Tax=uncultured Erythrobacter sp. TaxID=263913 RepID=UPI00262FFFA9|nr:hypothetical protein [uncultured Erythrobacter sp.]
MLTNTMLETKSADPVDAPSPALRGRRYRPKRTTADRVREALLMLAEGRASLLSHEEKAWSSITFTGTRHEMMLDFDGAEAVAVGEEFIANLPDHEFRIPGQLVADATVREVEHRFGEDERMVVTAELLLLEES